MIDSQRIRLEEWNRGVQALAHLRLTGVRSLYTEWWNSFTILWLKAIVESSVLQSRVSYSAPCSRHKGSLQIYNSASCALSLVIWGMLFCPIINWIGMSDCWPQSSVIPCAEVIPQVFSTIAGMVSREEPCRARRIPFLFNWKVPFLVNLTPNNLEIRGAVRVFYWTKLSKKGWRVLDSKRFELAYDANTVHFPTQNYIRFLIFILKSSTCDVRRSC